VEKIAYVHSIDPDGICSGAILLRRGFEIKFFDYSPMDYAQLLRDLPPKSFVVIADIGLDEKYRNSIIEKVKKARKEGSEIFWLDHHEWEYEELEKFCKIEVSKEYCGAELVFKYFGEDELDLALARIARDHDIEAWKHDPPQPQYAVSFPLASVIFYLNMPQREERELKKVIGELSEAEPEDLSNKNFEDPFYWSEFLKRLYKSSKKAEEKEKARILKTAEVLEVSDYRVGIACPIYLSSSVAGELVLREFLADLAILVYPNGKLSFRSRKLDCSKIAELFGGGGHKYAAGAFTDLKKEEIVHKLSEFLADNTPGNYERNQNREITL